MLIYKPILYYLTLRDRDCFPSTFNNFLPRRHVSQLSSVLQSSVPYHLIAVLHRFLWIIQALLFHVSASSTHLLRFLPHFDNNGLRNVFFVYVLYSLVVEYYIRRGESSLDALSMRYLIWLSTFLYKFHLSFIVILS